MPLLFESQAKATKPLFINGNKSIVPMDNQQWHRKKKRRRLSASSNGPFDEGKGLPAVQPKASQLKINKNHVDPRSSPLHDSGVRPLHTSKSTGALEELLRQPIQFVPASHLTVESEAMARTRPRAYLKDMGVEHRQRRQLTGKLSKEWPSYSQKPRLGLANPAQYCYRRSFMQCLIHIPIFVNWLATVVRQHKPNMSCSYRHGPATRCVACAFSALIRHMWDRQSSEASAALKDFDKAVRSRAGQPGNGSFHFLRNTAQADSHEFASFLVEEFMDNTVNRPPTVVQGLFKLRTYTERICSHCHHIHNSNPVDDTGISLPLTGTTLQQCIHSYFHYTVSAKCDLCARDQTFPVRRLVSATPEVLIVQLLRFRQLGHRNRKDDRRIELDDSLDLTRFANTLKTPAGVLKYRLQGVVAHSGTLDSGHYKAYCKGPRGVLGEFSDANVRDPVHADKWFAHEGGFTPYILTYVSWDGDVARENRKR